MSRAYLLGATDADPEMGAYLELGNSWGVNPMIWDSLVEKYGRQFGAFGFPFTDWGLLFKWALTDATRLEPWEWNVLLLTFPENYIEGDEDFLLYRDSLLRFYAVYAKPTKVCHLEKAAHRITTLIDEKKGVRWLAWYGTSVDTNPWGVYDEETEDSRPFNMVKDIDRNLRGLDLKPERIKMLPLGPIAQGTYPAV